MAEKAAAILTIRRAPDMTKRGRKAIAAWLRQSADTFEELGKEYSPLFTARYLYDDEKPTHARNFGLKGTEPAQPGDPL